MINPVRVQKPSQPADSGGGGLGGILGGIIGAAAAIATGGAAAPLIGIGMTGGGLIGSAVDKPESGKYAEDGGVPVQQSQDNNNAFARRSNQFRTDDSSDKIVQEAIALTKTQPPEIQEQAMPLFAEYSKKRGWA